MFSYLKSLKRHEFSSEHRNSDCNAGPVRVVISKLTRTERLQRRHQAQHVQGMIKLGPAFEVPIVVSS